MLFFKEIIYSNIYTKKLKKNISLILSLAIPAMVENIFQTIVGFVDTLFVARIGINEVAAVGITNAILAIYIAIFMALSIGTASLIARSFGAKDYEKAANIAKHSICLSIITGILFGLITLFFAKPLLSIMGIEKEVLDIATVYFKIIAVPSIFIALMFTLSSILRAVGDTRTPMKVSIYINIIHVFLDYIMIFGIFNIGGFGIAGAAWATVIVRLIGTIALLFFIQKKSLITLTFFKENMKYDYISLILNLSIPAAIERLIMRLGQILYFGLIIKIGTETYSAHIIAGNIEIISYMPGYGLAIAATTIVGQKVGENSKKDAYLLGMLTTIIAVLIMSIIGIFLFLCAPYLSTFFTSQDTVNEMVIKAVRISAIAQPVLAIGLVLVGALQGAGDTKTPMYSTAVGIWMIRVIGIYFLGIKLSMGITGVWLAIALDLFIRAIYLLYAFRKKCL